MEPISFKCDVQESIQCFSGLKQLFGGGSSAPTVQTTAVADTAEDEKKTKKLRTALYSTEGGAAGQEVTSVSSAGRSTLYGN